MDKKIILFDGVCNLCNSVVRFIIKHDGKDQFRFASLQGETGKRIMTKFHLPATADSFILVEGETVYTRSTGALRVLRYLGKGWQITYALIILPEFIRNALYNVVAVNRYRWFGKRNECLMPEPRLQSKFLP